MEVSLDATDRTLVLDLLAKIRAGTAGTTAAQPTSADRPSSARLTREERAKEALAEERAARKKAAANAALLKAELKADANATASARSIKPAAAAKPRGSSVRVTLCSIDRPSERKTVVLTRADDLTELLKTAKTKLKLKKAPLGAKLLDSSEALHGTTELDDGCVVAVCAEAAPPRGAEPASAAQETSVADAAQSVEPASEAADEAAADDASSVRGEPTADDTAAAAEAGVAEAPAAAASTKAAENGRGRSGSSGGSGGTRRAAAPMLPRRAEGSAALAEAQARLSAAAPPPDEMLKARAALPVAAHRAALLGAIGGAAATVVQGEPGCGKSTQLCQFLLDELVGLGRGGEAAIVVAQPRRVSAISLAQRVADERGESVGGHGSVGYAVRGERRAGPHCKILFCTTGWLLRQLAGCLASSPAQRQQPPHGGGGGRGEGMLGLRGLSHIVLDEVHERQMQSDFLLILLRDLLLKQRSTEGESGAGGDDEGGADAASPPPPLPPLPKVVCMSATLDADLFARYLGKGTPVVKVPGRTFPVRDLHLEQILELVGGGGGDGGGGGGWGGKGGGRGGKGGGGKGGGKGGGGKGGGGGRGGDWRGGGGGASEQPDASEIDYELLQRLAEHVATHGEHGAILIFLPGAAEIDLCCAGLASSRALSLRVVPLHGSLPAAQQRRAFDVAPKARAPSMRGYAHAHRNCTARRTARTHANTHTPVLFFATAPAETPWRRRSYSRPEHSQAFLPTPLLQMRPRVYMLDTTCPLRALAPSRARALSLSLSVSARVATPRRCHDTSRRASARWWWRPMWRRRQSPLPM